MSTAHTHQSPRRLKGSSVQPRDFFRLAASMANPSVKIFASDGTINPALGTDHDIFSSFLDLAHQECLYSFKSSSKCKEKASTLVLPAFEHADILHLHQEIIQQLTNAALSSFKLLDQRGKRKSSLFIDSAYLFSAHRLKNKSWQLNSGVVSSIRYFHAKFLSLKEKKQIDILYWLRFDEQDLPLEGKFIKTLTI